MVNNVGRSVAFGEESADLIELRQTLRSSMDVHYLNAIASRAISAKGRSFKGQSIENYTRLSNVEFTRVVFSGAKLQVRRRCCRPVYALCTLCCCDPSASFKTWL